MDEDTPEDVLNQIRTELLDLAVVIDVLIARIEQVSPPGKTWKGRVRSGAIRKGEPTE